MTRQPIGLHGSTHSSSGSDPIPEIVAISVSQYEIKVVFDDDTVTTGDNKFIFAIPSTINGYSLSACASFVTTVSSSGKPTVQVRNVNTATDILSTSLSIDVSEFTSYTAAVPPVINAGASGVSTGDRIAIDVDIAGTGARGLGVILTFSP